MKPNLNLAAWSLLGIATFAALAGPWPARGAEGGAGASEPKAGATAAAELDAEIAAAETERQKLRAELAAVEAKLERLRKARGGTAADPRKAPLTREEYAKDAAARRKPGFIVGTLLGADGTPLKLATAQVRVWGSSMEGHRVNFNVDVEPDGRFEMQLPNGLYKVIAAATVEFEGRRMPIDLEPLDGKAANSEHSSAQGIVKDYRMRLTGLKPGADPAVLYSYYGGLLNVSDRSTDLLNMLHMRHPKGSKVRVVLTPRSAALDGTKLKPIALETTMALASRAEGGTGFAGIPVARYEVRAWVVAPDGKARPLKVSGRMNGQFAESMELTWEPQRDDPELLTIPAVYLWD